MKYYKKLIGSRIYLSPPSMEDVDTYTKWLNDPSITDGLSATCRVIDKKGEQEWIERASGQYQFAIVTLNGDELLGNCGIQNINQISRSAEVGLFIGEEENRGKGYGAEALDLLLEYGFRTLNLHNIMLKVFSFNSRAIACYKKLGFREIGRRREEYFLKGQYFDSIYMDILEGEYSPLKR